MGGGGDSGETRRRGDAESAEDVSEGLGGIIEKGGSYRALSGGTALRLRTPQMRCDSFYLHRPQESQILSIRMLMCTTHRGCPNNLIPDR